MARLPITAKITDRDRKLRVTAIPFLPEFATNSPAPGCHLPWLQRHARQKPTSNSRMYRLHAVPLLLPVYDDQSIPSAG